MLIGKTFIWFGRTISITPHNFINKIVLSKYLIHYCLYIMPLFPVKMHIDTAIISKHFSQQYQSFSQKLNELCADDFIPVCLFPVFHKVLLCGKWRVYIYEFDFVLYAEFIL